MWIKFGLPMLKCYYQPAGPLISPHVLPSVASVQSQPLQQQGNLQNISSKSKQIPTPLDTDLERSHLLPPPSSASTVESSDSDVLITGGDLAPFRYSTQQQIGTSQSASVASQQQSQQQLHQQAAAAAAVAAAAAAAAHQGAPPYPRSMHQMHYTSAYPPNYYSPYPGEGMCYSPPYQPYFPAKVYQSAPPPPSYRRYPPYYQQGPHSGLPPPSDIYEQSPPTGGQPAPSGPPTGTQLVPAGPGAAHTQHLEHYPGPPGYYSGYSPGGGGQCYTRSPYMEYPPQCPCPMQQSCPKNVHTGPHIGSNAGSGSNNTSSSNTTTNTEAITNSTISNPIVATAAAMTPAASANIVPSADIAISKSTVTPVSKSNSSNTLPVSAIHKISGTENANNSSNQQQQLNISRGPVTNNTRNILRQQHKQQQLVVSADRSVGLDSASNGHHHFLHHSHHHSLLHHHHVEPCDEVELIKPLKSELKSEDIDVDSKISQYEEEVIQPPTPPLPYEKQSEEISTLKQVAGNGENNCTIEAFDLTSLPSSPKKVLPAPLVVGRKARIGKTMAREMVYAGAAAKPLRPQKNQQPAVQSVEHSDVKEQQSISLIVPALNSSSCQVLNNNNNNNGHKCAVADVLIQESKIKSEKIKTEKDEESTIVLLPSEDKKNHLNKIKTEPGIFEEVKLSSSDARIDDDIEITNATADGPKQRIKILEFHKNQCKKSPPNSYKSLIKQAEPKSYLCLSRKIEKRNRFGSKLKKSARSSVVRKRKLVLTDQQKKSLRIRKKMLLALEQKKERIREKRRQAALAQRLEKRQEASKEKLRQSNLSNKNQFGPMSYDVSTDLVGRGYFSEPETRCIPFGRKIRKSKTTETRSKSETKKSSSSLANVHQWEKFSSTSTKVKSPKGSFETEKPRAHKKTKSHTARKSIKSKLSYNNISNALQETSLTRTTTEFELVGQDRLMEISYIADNNNISEANNNSCSKTTFNKPFMALETSSEAITDLTSLSSNNATILEPHPPSSEFVFLRPAIPQLIKHSGSMKRIRSRSKFGCRKKQKNKHSISIEVDETIQPKRPDVVPKWNNGWRWEGEPFQGAVFLNSDDPHVIRTCYPAMRHSEGDIIRPRDCVLLKANEDNELPYVAKVAYLWENPEDGEMMMSLLWYYRPEHTEQGRSKNDCPDEVYASRHRDHNSVACIEDKCYVLVFREYCRYRRRLRAAEEDLQDVSIVPKRPDSFNPRAVPESTNPELVMFCRRAYEFRTKRLLKMPNKHENVTRSSN